MRSGVEPKFFKRSGVGECSGSMGNDLIGDFIGKWVEIVPKQNYMPPDDFYGDEAGYLCRILKMDGEFLLIRIHDGREILLSRESIREIHPAKAPRFRGRTQFTDFKIVEEGGFTDDPWG